MANRTHGSDPPRLHLMASPPLTFGVPFGAGVILHVMTGSNIETGENIVAVGLGAVLIAAGLLLSGWATIALRRAGEHPEPSRPTTALVADGPYRFSRNPIYVAFTLLGLGIGLILNSPWILGSVPVAVAALQILVIVREERYLESVIGPAYVGYRQRVRRWV